MPSKIDHKTDSNSAGSPCRDATPSAAQVEKVVAVASPKATVWRIATMDCSAEESEIRRALKPIADTRSLSFQLGARTLAIDADESAMQPALEAIRRAGFSPQPFTGKNDQVAPAVEHDHRDHAGRDHGRETSSGWSDVKRYVVALAFAVAAEALSFFTPDAMPWKIAGMALAAVAIGLAGLSTYTKGINALRHGRLNMNALMTVAVTGAFLIGQWPEAAMVMALYAIAELIEARAVDRARNAIKSLMALAPEESDVQQADGSYARMVSSAVPLAAVVRVKPGERIPLDGMIVSGSSAINQAPVTGESIPVDKQPGDTVFAGTINETATLEVGVTAVASNSTLPASSTRSSRRRVHARRRSAL